MLLADTSWEAEVGTLPGLTRDSAKEERLSADEYLDRGRRPEFLSRVEVDTASDRVGLLSPRGGGVTALLSPRGSAAVGLVVIGSGLS